MSSAIDFRSLPAHRSPALIRGVLEAVEKAIVLVFYIRFIYFLCPIIAVVYLHGDLRPVLLAISETLVVGLVLFRRRAQVLSHRPLDWALAFGATLGPTLVRPVAAEATLLTNAAAFLMLVGICLQIYSKSMLGRRFGVVPANRGICAEGPYRLVRHPIYLGYLLTHIGLICVIPSAWNVLVYAITYALMIPRIFAEERLLRRDPEYAAYCQRVRSRLIPGVL